MNKFSNIYDIDGNIINKSPQHNFTLEETEQLVDDLTKKVEENPDNEVYKVYLSNAKKWLQKLYNDMDIEDLMKRIGITQELIQKAKDEASSVEQAKLDEINKAIEQLKKVTEQLKDEYDRESGEGETGGAELDKEVEPVVEEPSPVIMDEYVEPIEETNEPA